ncbi:MAG: hypothetical protein KH297_03155 [Firmicutes bacterium]|nr:hypothetical protein [Bacillota bacterium]
MKILIIGSPDSVYIKYYIIKVLLPIKMEVYLSFKKGISTKDKEFYERYGVTLVGLYEKNGVYGKIPKLSTLLCYIRNLKKYTFDGDIDFIQIHYIGNSKLMKHSYKFLRKYTRCLISTFWGSDILDIDYKRAKQIEGLIDVSDKIVLSTSAMRDKFREYYGEKYDDKIESYLFGNQIIEKSLESKNKDRKKKKRDKFIVSIGYNGAERQQHLKVLEQMNSLPYDIKNKIHIVIQMSYGVTDLSYKDRINYSFSKYSLSGEIIEKYLDINDTIILRENVDLFINSQTTDALSSSVLEYIYFGAEVLNPEWINYKEWKDMGITYNEYNSFSDLNKYIIKFINGEIHTDHHKNANIIKQNFTWKYNAPHWQRLYK